MKINQPRTGMSFGENPWKLSFTFLRHYAKLWSFLWNCIIYIYKKWIYEFRKYKQNIMDQQESIYIQNRKWWDLLQIWPGWRHWNCDGYPHPIWQKLERILQTAYTAQITSNQDNFRDIPKTKRYQIIFIQKFNGMEKKENIQMHSLIKKKDRLNVNFMI